MLKCTKKDNRYKCNKMIQPFTFEMSKDLI